ncbi:MAG: VWA domain-containing protein [Ferruginibacter sp.]|nr:VWA domain-containing protein [Ferruginibacter sp.]
MLRFQYTYLLLALLVLPLLAALYFWVIRWKKKTILRIGDARLVKEIIGTYSPRRFAVKFVLVLLAFGFGVLALANLRKPGSVEKVSRSGIDIMIALDVSKSMLANDIKPNRLERAKQSIAKLIDKLGNDRIGIVVFAGRAYLQMPLTGDHGAARMYLASAGPDAVPTQGTVISEALKMCHTAFNPKEKKYKAVVLISDGEDHDEGAVPEAEKLAGDGIVINTVGIGSPDGATFMDELTNQPKKDANGNIVISKLNEAELKKIAESGNGNYQLFSGTDELVNKLELQLEGMDRRTITEDAQVNYLNFYPYFLAAALLLLLVEFFLPENRNPRKESAPAKALKAMLFVVLFVSGSSVSMAQDQKKLIKNGNEAYEKKDYGSAVTNYQQAISKKPGDVVAQYNLGNALYRNNNKEDAVQAYEKALASASTNAEKAKAWYNKGVALQNNNKLPECIHAYKQALKLDPTDEDARQNLQRALKQQKQQEEKKDNKENKEKKKPREDQKQKEKEKQKPQEQKEQPKPQPKISKQDAEEKLKALLQQEKNLQDKLQRVNTSPVAKPEKDW